MASQRAYLEAHSQPAVAVDAREESLLVAINASLILGDETLGLTVSTDGGDSSEGLLERSEDGRLGGGVEALQLARGGEVVAMGMGLARNT